jgi:protease-4
MNENSQGRLPMTIDRTPEQGSWRKSKLLLTPMIALLVGCAPPSLLITPVSTRHELVEAVLSSDGLFSFDKIAVIDVSGVIMNDRRSGLLSEGEHPISLLLEQLDKARRDPRVRAVILRVNSPGGTVVASELMHDEITYFKKCGKPIIAVMMDVAASGAYYAACACDEIVAQPSSVTGSIGVVMQLFDLSGTMNLIGARSDAVTSGPLKDAGSPLRQMRPEEREIFQGLVNDMYNRFVDVVVAGRPGLDEPRVRELADGRVYTATQAIEHGLIDRIATMRDVVASLKETTGSSRIRLITYHRPYDFRPNYYASAQRGDINLLNVELPAFASRLTPRFMYLWQPGQ